MSGFAQMAKGKKMTNTVIQERTDEKGWIHLIEIPLTTFLIQHNLEPVVRCKDCKHYRTRWYGFCELIENENIYREDNDFCSWAERRKNETG